LNEHKAKIRVPATAANLGPGFDCLALALDLWNTTTFILEDDSIQVIIEGEGSQDLPRNASNRIVRAFFDVYQRCGFTLPQGVHILCDNRIPLGSGLGSSAAAILTGIAGANTLLNSPLTKFDMLEMAAQMEGHADNAAAAVYGGLTLVTSQAAGKLLARSLECAPWQVVVVLPEVHLPTAEARLALPKAVSMLDAVFNIGHSLLTAEALRIGDREMLSAALVDRLHQPYRLALIPGAEAALQAAKNLKSPACLSGAGPSIIAFVKEQPGAVQAAVQSAFLDAGLSSRAWVLQSTASGIQSEFMNG